MMDDIKLAQLGDKEAAKRLTDVGVLASRINGGNSSTGRRQSDFYPTPPEVTVALMDFLKIPQTKIIWEPACGDGRMVDALKSMGYQVIGTDIRYGDDFLTTPLISCDWIITNPPFYLAENFIERCIEHRKPFALLLKSQYWNAARRKRLFDEARPDWILPLTWRPDFTGKGQAMMDMSWCVWETFSRTAYFQPLDRPTKDKMARLAWNTRAPILSAGEMEMLE